MVKKERAGKKATGPPVLLGIPFDAHSSFLRGPAQAPPLIRRALHSDAWNKWTENGVDLGAKSAFEDAGDLPPAAREVMFPAIESKVGELLEKRQRPVCLGGDHSITYPIMLAFGKRIPRLTLIHFDAHPDLYEEFEGNRLSHACPFARIMEERLAGRLIQIGIRTINAHQREQVARFGVEIYEMKKLPEPKALGRALAGPVYVSFDMDVLDPAFAPGVSHWEPGGLTVREVLSYLQAIPVPIIGADIVELNPQRDPTGNSTVVAAKILKELLGKMIL